MESERTTLTDARIGRTLGRYRIERELGRGGMGVVYLGRQLSLNRLVAIKVLPPQMAADPQFRRRFEQEARVIAALAHENLVHVYDIEEAEDTFFIVMELVDGQTVRAIREARRLTPEEIRSIGIAVARALEAAHRQGIIHRDVKSHNVMVTREGRVKLMDFGIARVAGGGGIKTATGSVLGTPEYMAPEQARSGESSPQTDIYSLGVLLYEIATGRLPFSGSDPFAVALKHISEVAVPPRQIDPTIPDWLETVIVKTLEKDPARRYASAAEVEVALAAGGQEGVPAEVVDTPAASLEPPPAPVGLLDLGSPAPPPTLARVPVAVAPAAPLAPSPTASEGGSTYAVLGAPRHPWRWLAAAVLVLAVGWGAWSWLRPAAHSPGAPTPAASSAEPAAPPAASTAPPNAAENPPLPARQGPTATPRREPAPTPRPVAAEPGPTPTPPAAAASRPPVQPEPVRASPPAPAASPPAVPEVRVSATFRCRGKVKFQVDPEEAVVSVDGKVLGEADDWDGMGRSPSWQPAPGSYVACFRLKGYHSDCVLVVREPGAKDEVCKVDTQLEEIDD